MIGYTVVSLVIVCSHFSSIVHCADTHKHTRADERFTPAILVGVSNDPYIWRNINVFIHFYCCKGILKVGSGGHWSMPTGQSGDLVSPSHDNSGLSWTVSVPVKG